MSLFRSEIVISQSFGAEYVESLVSCLRESHEVRLLNEAMVEPDLLIIDYKIGSMNISFLTEGMVGTTLLGKKKDIEYLASLLAGI